MKYWVYLNGEIPGSFEPEELAAIPGFLETSMVCPADVKAEERDWRRAGTYPDLIEALGRRPAPPPPGPEAPLPSKEELGLPKSPDDILNDASNSIFSHVTHLMQELETRREEHALTQQLQREVIRLKSELTAMRERNNVLQDRADLIPDYEARLKELMERTDRRQVELQDKEASLIDLRRKLDAQRLKLEAATRTEMGLNQDLKRQTMVSEELSKQLAEKELLLAKSFAVIRRLEATLQGVFPKPVGPTLGEYKEAEPATAPPPPDSEPQDPAPAANGHAENDIIQENAEPVIEYAEETVTATPVEAPAEVPIEEVAQFEHVAPTPEPIGEPETPGEPTVLDVAPPPEGDQPPITPLAPPWQQKLADVAKFLRDKMGLS
jgi:hypothetical protein